MSKPRKGKEVAQVCSIRLEPKTKLKIIKKYGSLQGFIDAMVRKL